MLLLLQIIISSIKNHSNENNQESLKKFSKISVLYEGFNLTNWSKILFYPLFMTRRIFISIFVIFGNGIFQMMASCIFSIMVNVNRTFYI